MKTMKIFEPAMCCATGLCGVSVDPELLRISTMLNALKQKGIEIKRYNLSNAPREFVNHRVVHDFLRGNGTGKLPLVLLENEIVLSGRYPTNQEIAEWLEFPSEIVKE